MERLKDSEAKGIDWLIAGALGALAAVVYFISMADYAFPGESAHLMALWSGLDEAVVKPNPWMAVFAKFFGCSNALGPVCGAISVATVYLLTAFFIRMRINGEMMSPSAATASRIAGASSALIFLFTPACHEAFTRLSSFGFNAAWALLTALTVVVYARSGKRLGWLFVVSAGAMTALGMAGTPAFWVLAAGYMFAVWAAAAGRGGKPYGVAFGYLAVTVAVFFIYAPNATGGFLEFMRGSFREARGWVGVDHWLLIFAFAILPFIVSLYSSYKAYNEQSGLSLWLFHLAVSFVSILAIATPLAPSELMRSYGVLPVIPCAMTAFTAGYLVAYWWLLATVKVKKNESIAAVTIAQRGRPLALAVLPVVATVYVITVFINVFSFDGDRGEFADRAAERLIADLAERNWLVTDGTLDDHIRIAAAKSGRELNLICLQRDLDEKYLSRLARTVEEKGVGGANNRELSLSLTLGVLPFVQDWCAADKDIGSKLAIFGAPDLWYSAGLKAVPEFLFFGADEKRKVDWSAWKDFDKLLHPPKGVEKWGSSRLSGEDDPVASLRLRLRRHLGLVANDRGVFLQDAGDDAGAFEMYDLVLSEIDADNICALFNEFEMARSGFSRAAAKKKEIEAELKKIIENKDRRYVLWKLSNFYGYIRNPEIFIRLGAGWARSGRPGDALSHIRRAIDFIPKDRRTALLNMMAALYASDQDGRKSRETYAQVLEKDAENREALIGMMRLELLEGNSDRAIEYLRRATAAAGDDPRVAKELAMLHMMKNEIPQARAMLEKAIDNEPDSLQTWSLFAAVVIQQHDAAKDDAARRRFIREIREKILPEMEKRASNPNDYHVNTTRAFLLMREGEENRRAARDAFVVAARERPDIAATQDIVLGLDISLNDTVEAERHARETLRRNRKAPLANYVMGSLALQKGNLDEAEMYLRKAADAPKPVVLAQNDLAEVYRRQKRFADAERYARAAIKTNPALYVAWETLGSVLMDAKGDLDEAEKSINKACALSRSTDGREEDVRMLISLARVQVARGDKQRARMTIRKVQGRIKELSEFERTEFEEFVKSVR
jgi:tetratricopeptide (TPR) repeat protein